MPTLTETEDRLRHTLHEVASSVHDADETTRHAARADVRIATPPTPSRVGRSRRRSPLLVFAASFLAVLAFGAIGILLGDTESNGDLSGPAVPSSTIPDGPSVVTGLGMDVTYFAIDDPSWTLAEAWATTEGGPGTYSDYHRQDHDQRVILMTGSVASDSLDSAFEGSESTLTLNSNIVTERSSTRRFDFYWTTSDSIQVHVTIAGMDRDQALEVGTSLIPIDSDEWDQLVADAPLTTPSTSVSEVRARTGRFGTGGEEGFGEWIRLDAPDAPELILGMAEGIELPPGHTFDRLIDNLGGEPTEMTEQGVMSMLEFEAGCIWTGYWLDAVETGDTVALNEAVAVLEEIPTWPALNATDGGGVVEAWTRNAELAAAGDVQGVLDNLYTNNCTDVVPGQ
jgi:hypothetical protein